MMYELILFNEVLHHLSITLQMFSASLQAPYWDFGVQGYQIVRVTCSMVLPQIIIENVSSNITGNSYCKYAI